MVQGAQQRRGVDVRQRAREEARGGEGKAQRIRDTTKALTIFKYGRCPGVKDGGRTGRYVVSYVRRLPFSKAGATVEGKA